MAQDKKLFSKIILILFLLMVVVGFTVPLLQLNGGSSTLRVAEPRICRADTDCYLMCENNPITVLCKQNLCQQNACTEQPYYPFDSEQIWFSLSVTVEGISIPLVNRTSSKDLFVVPDPSRQSGFMAHTSGLTVKDILEKVRMGLTTRCLVSDAQQYCSTEGKQLKIRVNGEDSFDGYVPLDGDRVEIVYE